MPIPAGYIDDNEVCESCAIRTYASCPDSIDLINIGLLGFVDDWTAIITDKFGNQYKTHFPLPNVVTGDSSIPVKDNSDFPKALFTKEAGSFTLILKDDITKPYHKYFSEQGERTGCITFNFN